jgi:hypothetical protein
VHINDYTSGQLAKASQMSEEFMSIWAQKTSKWHKSVDEKKIVAPRNGTPQIFCAFPKEMLFTHPGICKKVSEMSEEFMQFGHTKHPLLQIVCG